MLSSDPDSILKINSDKFRIFENRDFHETFHLKNQVLKCELDLNPYPETIEIFF